MLMNFYGLTHMSLPSETILSEKTESITPKELLGKYDWSLVLNFKFKGKLILPAMFFTNRH